MTGVGGGSRGSPVLLDIRLAAARGRGIPRYGRELARALPLFDRHRRYAYYCWPARYRRWQPAVPDGFNGAKGTPFVCSATAGRLAAAAHGRVDLRVPGTFVRSARIFHSFDFIPDFFAPSVATIATVHDMTVVRHPELFGAASARSWYALLRRTLPRCHAVVAVSCSTKADIASYLTYPADRIHVVHPWVPEELISAAAEPAVLPDVCSGPFILSVGEVTAKKNHQVALEAIGRLAASIPHAYVIAGRTDLSPEHVANLRARAAELGLADRVHLLGAVDDRTLAALYRQADLLLFPSIHEGFGYPLVEAMHFGTPIVTSHTGSMPEVAGDAALIVPPTDAERMAEAIEALLTDTALRSCLLAAGRQRRRQFTRERGIEAILAVYRAIEGRPLARPL